MPTVGIVIIGVGFFIAVYGLIYVIKGQPSNRGLAITNGIAGLFAAIMYSIFVYDNYFVDILTNEEIRAYCMRPITVVMLGAILANMLHIRWKL